MQTSVVAPTKLCTDGKQQVMSEPWNLFSAVVIQYRPSLQYPDSPVSIIEENL